MKLKKLLSILLVLCMSVSLFAGTAAFAATNSGSCGANVTWSYNPSTATLTISGTGAMDDYWVDNDISDPWADSFSLMESSIPWIDFRSSIESIIVEEGITYIGCSAFSNCTAVTSVFLPKTLATIERAAFYSCPSITDVNYGGTVADKAAISIVEHNTDLTAATWHYEVELPDYPCGSCGENLTWTLIDGVLTISGEGAMDNTLPWVDYASEITAVVIEAGVTSIADGAFADLSEATSISVAAENANYSSLGGNLYNKNQTVLVQYALGNSAFAFTVPSSVTTVASGAFSGATSLTELSLPLSVTEIEASAFSGCTSLASVIYEGTEEDKASLSIGADNEPLVNAAWTCAEPDYPEGTAGENLTWTIINGTLYISGEGDMIDFDYRKTPWYEYASEITAVVVNDGVTSVGKAAFYDMDALTKATLPNSVTALGDYAFAYCPSLTEVAMPTSLSVLGNRAFYSCSALTELVIPEGVTTITSNTFLSCSALAKVHFPKTLTEIKSRAFSECTALKTVVYNSNAADRYKIVIGSDNDAIENAVWQCIKSEYDSGPCGDNVNWTYENGVLTVSGTGLMKSFKSANAVPWVAYRDDVTEVIVEEGVTSLGYASFASFKNITKITLPSTMSVIERNVFYNGKFTDIYFGGSEATWQKVTVLAGNTAMNNATVHIENTGNIGGTCGSNITWTFAGGVLTLKGIGPMTSFKSSSAMPWVPYRMSIKEVVMDEGITTIGYASFASCRNLTTVTLPSTLVDVERNVFYGCKLSTIHNGGTADTWAKLNVLAGNTALDSATVLHENTGNFGGECGDNVNWHFAGGVLTISGTGAMTSFKSSSAMPWATFRPSIREVIVEEGVTSLGYAAFASCKAFMNLTLPESLTTIEKNVFYACKFTDIHYGGSPTAWNSIAIADGNNSINYATIHPAKLDTVSGTCGDNVTWVLENGTLTISGEGAMTAFKSSSAIPWADYRAFINEVVIEEGVTTIGYAAFSSCKNIASVTLPSTLTDVAKNAFYACTFTDVYYGGTAADFANISILAGNDPLLNATLHAN